MTEPSRSTLDPISQPERSAAGVESTRVAAGLTADGIAAPTVPAFAQASAAPVLAISDLWKSFGGRPAVQGISLAVPPGSLFGLVGPNGSGKTTTLRMACGLLRPDGGTIVVDGIDVWTDPLQAKARLGVVPDPLLLFERLTGMEQLRHVGILRGLPAETVHNRSVELIKLMGLTDAADQQIHSYSHGMRKKLALAVALIHRPKMLLLDEPFEGVDPVSIVALREVLDRFRQGGSSVIISSHAMDLVERHCDHVAVIAKGQVLASGRTLDISQGRRLEDAFISLVGSQEIGDGDLAWMVGE